MTLFLAAVLVFAAVACIVIAARPDRELHEDDWCGENYGAHRW